MPSPRRSTGSAAVPASRDETEHRRASAVGQDRPGGASCLSIGALCLRPERWCEVLADGAQDMLSGWMKDRGAASPGTPRLGPRTQPDHLPAQPGTTSFGRPRAWQVQWGLRAVVEANW